MFTVLAFCGFTVAYFRHRYVIRKYINVEDFSLIGLNGKILDNKQSLLDNEVPETRERDEDSENDRSFSPQKQSPNSKRGNRVALN